MTYEGKCDPSHFLPGGMQSRPSHTQIISWKVGFGLHSQDRVADAWQRSARSVGQNSFLSVGHHMRSATGRQSAVSLLLLLFTAVQELN